MKYNILLIGTGQLGSRHLQGLAKSNLNLEITILEPNEANYNLAITRFQESSPNENIRIGHYFNDVNQLESQTVDLAIIATNADIRAEITLQLLNILNVKFIIFEKVAFQSENQFEEVIKRLEKQRVLSWVNCPRRFFPFYQNLKTNLTGPFKIEVLGYDWGLSCNSVHFLDLLSYLSGEVIFKPLKSRIDRIFESKRVGFIEFYGFIAGKSESENLFTFQSLPTDNRNEEGLIINLYHKDGRILINEMLGVSTFHNLQNEIIQEEKFATIYQSYLTHVQIEQILLSGKSRLPDIETAFKIQQPLLNIFRDKYISLTGQSIDQLPIT